MVEKERVGKKRKVYGRECKERKEKESNGRERRAK